MAKNKSSATKTGKPETTAGKKSESTTVASVPHPERRNDILKQDSIVEALKSLKKKRTGSLVEQAERLEAYYLTKPQDEQSDCRLPPRDEAGNFPPGSLGCGYVSLYELPACPFCGESDFLEGHGPSSASDDAESKGQETPAENEEDGEGMPVPPPVVSRPVRVSSATVKARRKSKERASVELDGVASTRAPDDEPEAAVASSGAALTVREQDEAEMVALAGRTSKDLDDEVRRVHEARELRERTDAATFWEEGDALRKIFEEKLYCTVRRASDGGPEYRSFGEFVIRQFDYSNGHAFALIAIARTFDKQTAERLKVAAAKSIAQAPEEERSRLVSWALGELVRPGRREPEPRPTTREVMAEVANINRRLKAPPPAFASSDGPVPKVRHDADGVVIEDENVVGETPRNEKRSAPSVEPKTITVSYAETRSVIPLHVSGSDVKAAKKISDGPHGSFVSLNGMTIELRLKVGDEGQLQIVQTIRRPG